MEGREAMKIELDWPDNMPTSEFSIIFLQGMLNRMAMSYTKYGKVKDGFPQRVNALDTMKLKFQEFLREGNTEKLIDAANYLMIEFMHPKSPHAHYTPTDGSTGRIFNGGN